MTKLLVGHEQVSLKPTYKVEVQTGALTFDLATRFLFATHRLVMIIICAKLVLNPKLWLGDDSGTHTHTHTHTQR